jgi:hypothetical protein
VPGRAEMWHRTSLMEVHILKRFTVEIVPLTARPLEWNCRKNQRRANLSQHSGRRQLQGKGSCLLSLVRSYRQPVAGSFRCTSAFWCVPPRVGTEEKLTRAITARSAPAVTRNGRAVSSTGTISAVKRFL